MGKRHPQGNSARGVACLAGGTASSRFQYLTRSRVRFFLLNPAFSSAATTTASTRLPSPTESQSATSCDVGLPLTTSSTSPVINTSSASGKPSAVGCHPFMIPRAIAMPIALSLTLTRSKIMLLSRRD